MKICKFCDTKCEDSASLCPSCGANGFKYVCANCGTEFDSGNFCPKCGVKAGTEAKKCPKCGADYFSNACPNCGYVPTRTINIPEIQITRDSVNLSGNTKNKWVALALCVVLGYLGAHKFYEGKNGMGILYLFTFGLFGIGWIIDIIAILGKPENYNV